MEIKIRTRRAQLIAEAVSVCCPYCGEPQPSRNGSEMWTHEDFAVAALVSGKKNCVSCDAPMLILGDSKAQFR